MTAVVLAVGPEAEGLVDLGLPTAAPGRALTAAVRGAATTAPADPVVVVPMTFGRQPSLVADSARSLREIVADGGARVALAEPFGDTGHLIAHLRSAIRRHPGHDGVLVSSTSIDPFADADLFRIARLVWQFGTVALVEVAFDHGADPDVATGLERCRRLGSTNPLHLRATLGLLGRAAVHTVVQRRVHAALHQLGHGDDGLAAGVAAEDGHGYAHSHVAADGSVIHHSH